MGFDKSNDPRHSSGQGKLPVMESRVSLPRFAMRNAIATRRPRRVWMLAPAMALLLGSIWGPAIAQQQVPAPVSYQRDSESAASPFSSGALLITVSFPDIPAAAPLISINQPGTSDVSEAAMTATAEPTEWTYAYEVSDHDGSAFSDGRTLLTARAATAEETEMVISDQFAIRTQAPNAPTLALLAGQDTGAADDDRIININTPTITGTLPDLGERRDLSRGRTALVDSSNPADFTDPELIFDGDQATFGVVTPEAGSPSFVIDLTQPWLVHHLILRTADAAGQVNGSRMAIDGSNTGASASWVNIYDDDSARSEGVARELPINNQGPWRYLRVRAVDRETGMRFYDLQVQGTERGEVELLLGEELLGEATSAADGGWSITPPALAEGVHVLTARVADEAGNQSAVSSGLTITIDRSAPSSSVGVLPSKSSSAEISIPFSASDSSAVASTKLYFATSSDTPLDQYTQFGPGFTDSPIPFTAPTDGTYYFYTRALDVAGNVEAIPAEHRGQVLIDTTPEGSTPSPQPSLPPSVDEEQLSEVDDISAPRGDQVLLLTEGEVTLAPVPVTPGSVVGVTGYWKLQGHGTELQLCFDEGTCDSTDRLGRIGGSTEVETEWRQFALQAVVPEGASEAFLSWAVGSEAYLDSPQWTISSMETMNLLESEYELSVSAPALIDFGTALVGDTAVANDLSVEVISTNPEGYKIEVQADHLRRVDGGSSTIGATNLSFREGTQSFAALIDRLTRLQLFSTETPTTSEGVEYLIDIELYVPPVPGGLYSGTIGFSATAFTAVAPPEAYFTMGIYDSDSGTGITVEDSPTDFTDGSTGEITSWDWDFGDSNTSTSENPSHTFADPGGYTVTLTVTGPGGSDVATMVVTVEEP